MSIDSLPELSFSEVFSRALRGHPCSVVGIGAEPLPLPVADWTRDADDVDHSLLRHCIGATLDVGCGPGRLTARLAELGHVVLGIDVVREAVLQTRGRGVAALVRDIFDRLPGEGRWQSALLADGNVGIGGDPVALLRRLREVLDPRGRIVVELAGPGVGVESVWAALECGDARSRPFRWSVVGIDAIHEVAARAGLAVVGTHAHGERWSAVLEEAA
ncbi:bifunctional 2-polyprenyl-6-hydroxyphenol methylase/3-demethylubiquinol 3-O-methyltransferase UbiG [Nocardioides sp. LS1]|uniref:class I SAM-dependent methyltransferase n=1 Tax=Nocardioides sp. LS1 TaxID=1027620 RepID=UPI000F61B7D4|nr:methyltransferase domain-containing protein [Nocardioides sp. LS1]GCD88730.1 methyltransferase type 12 [Nocardioides sp. LS1]